MRNTIKLFGYAVLSACTFASCAFAQEEAESTQVEISAFQFGEGAGGATPMIIETVEESGDGSSSSAMRIVTADPGSSEMTFFGDSGMFMSSGGMDSFSMLSNPSVRKELELVDDQMDKIRDVNNEFSKKLRDSLGDLSSGNFGADRAADLKNTIAEIQADKKAAIEDLLLPHQKDRLEQVALQMRMKSRGTANALGGKELKEALGLTDQQIADMKKRSKELKKEIAEKTKQLKADAKNELLDMLTKDQRSKLEKMMGDSFETRSDDWKSDIQRRMKRRSKQREEN